MLRPVTGDARLIRKSAGRPPSIKPRSTRRAVAPAPLSSAPGSSATTRFHQDTRRTASASSHKNALIRTPFSYIDFAKQLALKPVSTGAIAPSSKSLARQTISQACLDDAKTVVELGPGTGVFTEEILRKIKHDQTFFAIELNKTFVNATKNRCPDACVYHDAAVALPVWLEKNNTFHADRIISSLPWTIFEKPEQDEMMSVINTSLAEDGIFVSIVYLGAKFRSRGRHFINNLQHHFSSVTYTPTVWQNLPPTQIIRCVK